jgi:cell division protein FtsA
LFFVGQNGFSLKRGTYDMPKTNETVVLDVGSGKIRAAVAEKSGQGNITILGIGEADYAGFADGEWLDESGLKSAIVSALTKAESSSGKKIKKVTVGVPTEFTYATTKETVHYFEAERKITDNDITLLFKKGDRFDDDEFFETVNVSPVYFLLSDNKRVIEPRGIVSNNVKALVSYIRSEKKFTRLFRSVIDVLGYEVEFVSAVWTEIMYLFEPEQRDRFILFADIGYITSSVALFRGDGVLHLSSFSIGGAHVSADLAAVFEIPFKDAEALKPLLNLDDEDDTVTLKVQSGVEISVVAINDVVNARIESFATMIERCIKRSAYECPPHLTLFLTGGGLSDVRGAKEYLSELIGRSVEIIAPNVLKFDKPYYASLFGLIDLSTEEKIESEPKKKNAIKKFIDKITKKSEEQDND